MRVSLKKRESRETLESIPLTYLDACESSSGIVTSLQSQQREPGVIISDKIADIDTKDIYIWFTNMFCIDAHDITAIVSS